MQMSASKMESRKGRHSKPLGRLLSEGPLPTSSSSAIDSRAGQIFSRVDATKPAVR